MKVFIKQKTETCEVYLNVSTADYIEYNVKEENLRLFYGGSNESYKIKMSLQEWTQIRCDLYNNALITTI